MNQINIKQIRILALAPTTRGVGYAVLEETLIGWGVKTIGGDKNKQSVSKVKQLIVEYQPSVIVLQNTTNSQRSDRIKKLSNRIIIVAKTHKVKVALFSHEQVRRSFFGDAMGTKDALAEIIAKQFPEELGSRLPPKRKAWMSESYQMGIFDAVALALMPSVGLKKYD